jgi:uncharacterized protein YjbI with pentapeptide repeats
LAGLGLGFGLGLARLSGARLGGARLGEARLGGARLMLGSMQGLAGIGLGLGGAWQG